MTKICNFFEKCVIFWKNVSFSSIVSFFIEKCAIFVDCVIFLLKNVSFSSIVSSFRLNCVILTQNVSIWQPWLQFHDFKYPINENGNACNSIYVNTRIFGPENNSITVSLRFNLDNKKIILTNEVDIEKNYLFFRHIIRLASWAPKSQLRSSETSTFQKLFENRCFTLDFIKVNTIFIIYLV